MNGALPLFDGANYRTWLYEVLRTRRLRNPSYSLRAFCSSLGLSHATISQVIGGKRPLTRKMAFRIAERMGLPPDSKESLVRAAHLARVPDAEGSSSLAEYLLLETESFKVISDWYHLAILCLSRVPGASHRPSWIAKRLGIPVSLARTAFARLERLGYLEKTKRGFKERDVKLTTSQDVVSSAARHYHLQNLRKAETVLDQVPVELRDFSAITVPIDMKNLPEAKASLQKFRRSIASLLEKGKPERVYTLAIQLFPVDHGERKESRGPNETS